MLVNSLLDNFYLTDEELADSPSRKDAYTQEAEDVLRAYGAELIQEASVLLECPQAVAATAQVLLQRFYCKRSFKYFNVRKLAMAATFLATKLEECSDKARIRDVLMVFDRLIRRKEGGALRVLEPGTNEYLNFKESMIRYEREMLRVFGFIVNCDHPHKLLINMLHALKADNALVQEAWNIANDSLRTTLCVRFKSEVVASGVIFYAARRLQVPLPEELQLPNGAGHWWEVFEVSTQELAAVVAALHALYSRPTEEYHRVLYAASTPGRAPVLPAAGEARPLGQPTPEPDAKPTSPDGGRQAAVPAQSSTPEVVSLAGDSSAPQRIQPEVSQRRRDDDSGAPGARSGSTSPNNAGPQASGAPAQSAPVGGDGVDQAPVPVAAPEEGEEGGDRRRSSRSRSRSPSRDRKRTRRSRSRSRSREWQHGRERERERSRDRGSDRGPRDRDRRDRYDGRGERERYDTRDRRGDRDSGYQPRDAHRRDRYR